jgi:hypothetical protein
MQRFWTNITFKNPPPFIRGERVVPDFIRDESKYLVELGGHAKFHNGRSNPSI